MIWWHRLMLRHKQTRTRVSPPLFDMAAKGFLVKCECKKVWAL